jgi:hypothetical protein
VGGGGISHKKTRLARAGRVPLTTTTMTRTQLSLLTDRVEDPAADRRTPPPPRRVSIGPADLGQEPPAEVSMLPGHPRQPDSRSPLEVVHSEEYLVHCLVRHYGWHWAAVGVLRRPIK